jgi:hypothetical protein
MAHHTSSISKLDAGKLLGYATELTDKEFRILMILYFYSDGNMRNARPGAERIAREADTDVRYARRILRSLEAKKYIVKTFEGGRGRASCFSLAFVDTLRNAEAATRHQDNGCSLTLESGAPSTDKDCQGNWSPEDNGCSLILETDVPSTNKGYHAITSSDQDRTAPPSAARQEARASRGAPTGTPREQLKACQTLDDLVAFRHRFPDREGSLVAAELFSEQRSQVIRRTVADEMQRLETPEDIRDFRERYYDLIRYSSELRNATDERAGEIFDANADKFLYDLQACDDLDSLEDFGDRFDYIPREEFFSAYRDRTNAVVARVAASILATLHTPAEISEFESTHHLLHRNRAWDDAKRNRHAELAVMS